MITKNLIGRNVVAALHEDVLVKGFIVDASNSVYIIKVVSITNAHGEKIPKSSICHDLYTNINRTHIADPSHSYVYCAHDKIKSINKPSSKFQEWNNKYKCWNNTNRSICKCSICGNLFMLNPDINKADNGKCICSDCSCVKGYYTRNTKAIKSATKKRTKYGFELEGVCIKPNLTSNNVVSHNDIVKKQVSNVMSLGYGIIPTYDGSLPIRGVEFKTPIMRSLRGAKAMIDNMSKYVDFSNSDCGQHINISNPKFTNEIRNYIAHHHRFLDILAEEMFRREDDTRLVCGRHFTDTSFARGGRNYFNHSNWINLSHGGRAEFRLSKIRNSKQYVALAKMWEEMMMVMVDYFNHANSNIENIDNVYGNKLIKIFDKYVDINKNMS